MISEKLSLVKNNDIDQFSLNGKTVTAKVVDIYDADTCKIVFELDNKCTGNLTSIFACPYISTFNVYGTKINILSQIDDNKITIVNKRGKVKNLNLINHDTLFLELQEFSATCINKKKYRIKNKEAVHNVAVMEAIVKSSNRKKMIYIK